MCMLFVSSLLVRLYWWLVIVCQIGISCMR